MSEPTYPEKYYLCKANKTKTGSAIQLGLIINDKTKALFLEAANENPKSATKTFLWDKDLKITMKLDIVDIGKLLDGMICGKEVKLFHQNEKTGASTTLNLVPQFDDNGNLKVFYMNVAKKLGDKLLKVNLPVGPDEVAVITTLFRHSIVKILGW